MSLNPDLAAELRKRIAGEVRLDLPSRILYSTDASIYQIEPLAVVIPRTRDDLQVAVELAAKHRVPIVPRGAGTSLAGQAIGAGIILDCSRWLDRVIEIDAERMFARVEPGVILSNLNRDASRFGLQFGPDPASAERATIGGVVANNATGAHSIAYGMTADHVVAADVVLSDGSTACLRDVSDAELSRVEGSSQTRYENIVAVARQIRDRYAAAIRETFPRTWRNSAGYRLNYLLPWSPSSPPGWPGSDYPARSKDAHFNTAQLLAGSEGTLAIMSEVTLGLVAMPPHRVLAVIEFPDLPAACDAVPALLDLEPSAVELIPRLILDSARRVAGYATQMGWLRGDPVAILVVEFSGDNAELLRQRASQIGPTALVLDAPRDQAMVWGTRKAGLGLLDSRPQSTRPVSFIEDCAIPVEHLAAFVREIQRVMAEYAAEGGIYGHASAGCLHIRPVLNLKTDEGVSALRRIAEQTLELALRFGGAMSSEHGDGLARGEWLRKTYGDEVTRAMLALKHAADPHGLLNPGKMFDAPPMDTQLRYGPAYRSMAWESGWDLRRSGGLEVAIEQCNGQGVCRKETGVMCPSYQATREEVHSTRGRANLLRALISAGLNPALTGLLSSDSTGKLDPKRKREVEDAVSGALDLCLACKGCTAECPSGVNMPRLKAAFLEHRYRTRPRPLRDFLFGYMDVSVRLLSAAGGMAAAATRLPVVGSVALAALGITTKRPLPNFGARGRVKPRASGRPPILLARDPFTHYADGRVEEAAILLLEAAGLDVVPLAASGAGAALISKGFLGAAQRHARRLLAAADALDADASAPLLFLEPSELSAVRDDYSTLLPDLSEADARRVKRARSVEEFLVESAALPHAPSAAGGPQVLFHPHCHEKAGLLGAATSGEQYAGMDILRNCGYQVELVDAGCCGMAGTFGYEKEHFELSQQIGDLRLFPAIRQSKAALVSATGASCRLHISQATGRAAEHPLVLAARALALI